MKPEQQERIIAAAKREVCAIIDENTAEIFRGMDAAIVNSNGADNFKFKIGTAVMIRPRGKEADVWAQIQFSVPFREESEAVTVSDQMELPSMEGGE